jgi:hypothetical protein
MLDSREGTASGSGESLYESFIENDNEHHDSWGSPSDAPTINFSNYLDEEFHTVSGTTRVAEYSFDGEWKKTGLELENERLGFTEYSYESGWHKIEGEESNVGCCCGCDECQSEEKFYDEYLEETGEETSYTWRENEYEETVGTPGFGYGGVDVSGQVWYTPFSSSAGYFGNRLQSISKSGNVSASLPSLDVTISKEILPIEVALPDFSNFDVVDVETILNPPQVEVEWILPSGIGAPQSLMKVRYGRERKRESLRFSHLPV